MSVLSDAKETASAAEPSSDLPIFAAIQRTSKSWPRVPEEIIMFAIDTSESMRWPAASCISDKYDDELWLGQDQEATASRHLSYEAGHIHPKKAIESMPLPELRGSYRIVTDYIGVID